VFIDKDDGVNIDDCTNVSHAIDPVIDEADPIDGSYYLEISSPGLERELKTPDHIKAFIGERVIVKLYAAKDGKKSFDGNIVAYNDDDASLTLEVNGSEIVFGAKEYSSIKTVCEF
jgi:ribosome maturation factor RimP